MAMISKAIVEASLRKTVLTALEVEEKGFGDISNQSVGKVFVDENGVHRLCEVKVILRAIDEEMTAEEMLAFEMQEYEAKLAEKAEKKAERDRAKAEKIAKDKAKREAAKAKKEAEAE